MKKFYTLALLVTALAFSHKAFAQPVCHASFYVDTVASTPFNAVLVNNSSGTSIIPPDSLLFSWMWGDGTTSTGRYPTHTYSSAGNKYVILMVENTLKNCHDSIGKWIHIDTTGRVWKTNANYNIRVVAPGQSQGVALAPATSVTRLASTYVKETANVLFTNVENGTLVSANIYSLDGKNVYSENNSVENNSMMLQAASLKGGMYVVVLNVEGRTTALKMIKQ